MHRFMSSVASSSSGRAEQPAAASSSFSSAEQPSSSLRSAEQPATPSHFQILSIWDVQRWLAVETVASCSSADMERIREAAAVLSRQIAYFNGGRVTAMRRGKASISKSALEM